MPTFLKSFAGKRIFLTGHTGFKGSWLSEWLLGLGGEVWGFSLPPPTTPSLFNRLALKGRLNHRQGDIRDAAALKRALWAARPDYVFHLAAQPIVGAAHQDPKGTWETNVMGTINLLEALRSLRRPCAAVMVTTDKVYRGCPDSRGEDDPFGAIDPYGGSKAAVELAVEAWRNAYFQVPRSARGAFPRVALATARSGNVIGGGDWASDRLLPDCVRALSRGDPIVVRNPRSVRPWQHVLDPLAGYMKLGAELHDALAGHRAGKLAELSGPFNFGPAEEGHRPVREVVAQVLRGWPGRWRKAHLRSPQAEAAELRLDSSKARRLLGWRPRWGFERAVDQTVAWYRGASAPRGAAKMTLAQLGEYTAT